VFAQRLLVFTLNKLDDRLTGSSGDSLSGIPDPFFDRLVVRHLFGTFIETDADACAMDSVSLRSYIIVSGASLTQCASPFSVRYDILYRNSLAVCNSALKPCKLISITEQKSSRTVAWD
jgi:hypothetical protein